MSALLDARASIAELLAAATRRLERSSDSPRLDAELLLGLASGLTRSQLHLRATEPPPASAAERFAGLIDERLAGMPVAYLTGRREFWSLDLEVSPAVLVPRPETETLIERALERLPLAASSTLLDLGTGSGAIALALATERPQLRIVAVDLSPDALAVARRNAHRIAAAAARIDFRLGSWFEPVAGERFEMIVANPPYIARGDPALASLTAEPLLALAAGPTGLEALTLIIDGARRHLEPGGHLLLEHGADQAASVARLLEEAGFTGIETHDDYAGRPRVARSILPFSHQERTT
jgi:release factor glutamine methyltransferase